MAVVGECRDVVCPDVVLKPQKSKMERINEKKAQRRTKEVEASKAEEEEEAPKLSEAEERRRREELQKESDLRLAMETFGGGAEGGTSTLDAMNPKTEEEFISFKDALSGKITQYEVWNDGIVWNENSNKEQFGGRGGGGGTNIFSCLKYSVLLEISIRQFCFES